MMNVMLKVVLAAAMLAVHSGCDPVYPLFLRNGLTKPVTVQTQFDGDAPMEGVLQPGQRLAFLHPKGDIERVIVIYEGRTLHELHGAALLDLRNSVTDPRRVTWNIELDGIRALSRTEVERLEKNERSN